MAEAAGRTCRAVPPPFRAACGSAQKQNLRADIPSDVMCAVRMQGAIFFRISAVASRVAGAAPAERLRRLGLPDAQNVIEYHVIEYHVVVSGRCRAGSAGSDERRSGWARAASRWCRMAVPCPGQRAGPVGGAVAGRLPAAIAGGGTALATCMPMAMTRRRQS